MKSPFASPTSGASRPSLWQIAKWYGAYFFLISYVTHPLDNESFFQHLTSSVLGAVLGSAVFTLLYRMAPKIAIGATILLLLWAGGEATAQNKNIKPKKIAVQTLPKTKKHGRTTTPVSTRPRQVIQINTPLSRKSLVQPFSSIPDTCSPPLEKVHAANEITAYIPGKTNPLKSLLTPVSSQSPTLRTVGVGVSFIQSGGLLGQLLFRSRQAYGLVGIGFVRSPFWGKNTLTLHAGGGIPLGSRLSAGLQTYWVLEKQMEYQNGQSRIQTKPFLALALVGSVQISSKVAIHLQYAPRSSIHNLSGFGLTYFL